MAKSNITEKELREKLVGRATKIFGESEIALRRAMNTGIADDIRYLAAVNYVDVYRQMRALGGKLSHLDPSGKIERLADKEISAEDFTKYLDDFDRKSYQDRVDGIVEDFCGEVEDLLEKEIDKHCNACPQCGLAKAIEKDIAEFDEDDFDDEEENDAQIAEALGTICRYSDDEDKVIMKVRIDKIVTTAVKVGKNASKDQMLWVSVWIDPESKIGQMSHSQQMREARITVRHWHPEAYYINVKFVNENFED